MISIPRTTSFIIARSLRQRLGSRFFCAPASDAEPQSNQKVFAEAWQSVPMGDIFGVTAAIMSAPFFMITSSPEFEGYDIQSQTLKKFVKFGLFVSGFMGTGFIATRYANRAVRAFSPVDLKSKIYDSKLSSVLIGLKFPFHLGRDYRNKIAYDKREHEKYQQAQAEQGLRITGADERESHWRAAKHVAFQNAIGLLGFAAYGAMVIGVVTLPVGAVLGLVTRQLFRRSVARVMAKQAKPI